MSKLQKLVLHHKDGTSEFIIKDENAPAFDEAQNKTDEEKAQARMNMNASKASLLYASLSSAIADLNNGMAENVINNKTAPVEVFTAQNGEKVVRLLADVSESAQIDIATDMTLVLNGHTLNLTTEGAQLVFAAGTNCKVNGEVAGSAIKKENITSSGNLNTVLVYGDLRVCGGSYSIGGSLTGIPKVFGVGPDCKVIELDGVELLATNTSTTTTKATKTIQSQALRTIVKNSTAIASSQKGVQTIHVQAEGALEIEDSAITATSPTSACGVLPSKCKAVIKNSTITATSAQAASGMQPTSGANIKIENSHISASGYNAHGIQATAADVSITVANSVIFTDAHGAHADTGYSCSQGIKSNGTVVCIDTDVTGTHTAVQSSGNLFVKGGTFSGYSHGGFYFIHDAEHQVYINNATLEVGIYHGSFEDFGSNDSTHRAIKLAGFYLGQDELDSPGISVFMDGCTIEGEAGEPFVVRPAAPSYTNALYISNTANNATTSKPIRLNGYAEQDLGNRAEMKIGMGCSFTPADTTNPECAEETGKLYRRMKEDMPMDGRDFAALLAYAEAQNT